MRPFQKQPRVEHIGKPVAFGTTPRHKAIYLQAVSRGIRQARLPYDLAGYRSVEYCSKRNFFTDSFVVKAIAR